MTFRTLCDSSAGPELFVAVMLVPVSWVAVPYTPSVPFSGGLEEVKLPLDVDLAAAARLGLRLAVRVEGLEVRVVAVGPPREAAAIVPLVVVGAVDEQLLCVENRAQADAVDQEAGLAHDRDRL